MLTLRCYLHVSLKESLYLKVSNLCRLRKGDKRCNFHMIYGGQHCAVRSSTGFVLVNNNCSIIILSYLPFGVHRLRKNFLLIYINIW